MPFGIQVDQLSAVMMLVVTGVGLLIFIYSKGYMHLDPGYYRFFAYLSLFAFSMLMLVLGEQLPPPLLRLGGGGALLLLPDRLLLSQAAAASAGKKAFLTNRVGDFGFGLGVMLIFVTFGNLQYTEVFKAIEEGVGGQGVMIAIALLLFMGAMGKSAQFPLHVWLPDAMEGPTPVSALIHAATMVTAGVYLVARSSVIFASAHTAMMVVGIIGTFTAIFAATIGIAQNDIKKVLAYSTVSQLGFMFMALGVGAWVAAIFHLVMHAFFKALLFLGLRLGHPRPLGRAGHAQDGRLGARRSHTRTGPCSAGRSRWPASSRLPGFWSKDEILGINFKDGQYVMWAVGLVTAFITAFYTFRLMFMTFQGESRVDPRPSITCTRAPSRWSFPSTILPPSRWCGLRRRHPA